MSRVFHLWQIFNIHLNVLSRDVTVCHWFSGDVSGEKVVLQIPKHNYRYFLSATVWENRLSKKSTFSYRLFVLIFWKPISNLVIWQVFRIFGHSLTVWQGWEESEWDLFRHFFRYSPFSLKVVPFSQFWTKSNNSNTHFRAIFMLYTNSIIIFVVVTSVVFLSLFDTDNFPTLLFVKYILFRGLWDRISFGS